MSISGISSSKKELRKHISLIIRELDQTARSEYDLLIKARIHKLLESLLPANCLLSGLTPLFYMPLPDEPDITSIYDDFADARIALPVSNRDGSLSFRIMTEDFKRGLYNIDEPAPDSQEIPVNAIDIAFIPGRAFGTCGQRLGRGKGYYDRFLKDSDCTRVGFCYEEQIINDIPMEPHDQYLDYVITPERTINSAEIRQGQ